MSTASSAQNMQCFDLVRTVLDELYPSIPGESDHEKDKLIVEKMTSLSKSYRHLKTGNNIDHSDLVGRFAYIYKYVTSHANIVFQLINTKAELKNIFEQDTVKITCVGGGPGSDFLGVIKYLLQENKNIHLNCTLIDKENSWNESWGDIGSKVPQNLRFNTNYDTVDITVDKDWATKQKFLNADLFTLTFFMSEVYSIKEKADPFFQNLFANAKKGSFFIFIDNNNDAFYQWFDSLCEANNFDVLYTGECSVSIDDADKTDEMKLLGKFWEKFKDVDYARPKKRSDIAYRIVRKI